MVFTSGSTGRPKVVEITHRALLNYCSGLRALTASIEPLDTFAVMTTFAADIGKASIYGALLPGACLPEALASEGPIAGLLPRRLVIFIGEALPPRLVGAIAEAAPETTVLNQLV